MQTTNTILQAPALAKPTILLVDDVEFFLEVEKGYLKQTYADIITARNGQEALQQIAEQRPDLIYMDVNMPIMNGIECCTAIKNDPDLKSIPIIFVYATSKDVNDDQISASGCDGYILKPIDRRQFLEIGRKFLPKVDRRSRRVPCQMSVEISSDGKRFQGRGYDISSNGMYIEFKEEMAEKERLRIAFFMPTISPKPIETWSEVTWVNQGFPRTRLDMPQGFGVEFKLTSREDRAVIDQFVDQVPEDDSMEC